MKLCKEVLQQEYHLLNESNIKIEKYTLIVNTCSRIDEHVYEKLELY